MRRHRVPLILSVLILAGGPLLAGGCDGGSTTGRPPGAAGSAAATGRTPGESAPGASADGSPADPDTGRPAPGSRTAYSWGVPTAPARISHPDRPPAAPPPAPPLPYLVKIESADHPEDDPGYSRISFTFRGGFPSYHLEYVPAVRVEGSGEAIPLPGNAFLRVRFVQAQAHDHRGVWTVSASPSPELGYRTLLGYGFAGDFEGYLSYGLGVRVPADSDRAVPVRTVEVTHTDGTFVIAVDVRHA